MIHGINGTWGEITSARNENMGPLSYMDARLKYMCVAGLAVFFVILLTSHYVCDSDMNMQ